MANESRLHKSFLNARVNLIFYFLTLLLAFFSRKIFLDSLGADFVGLTGTLQNLLGFLNLAEMGIGAAIGYVLYKPLFDQNQEKINEIISVMGYMYRCVGLVILGAGVILAMFLPMIFAETKFELLLIYAVYFSFLTSSLIGYFINYRQTLLGADQRNYVVTAYFQTANICKVIIQMLLAKYTGNYYLWAFIELSFGIVYSFILNYKIDQVYPWLRSEVKLGRKLLKKYPDVIKYTKQLFVHKIGSIVHTQISPFLIYAFASLQTVAYYGNYTLIVSKLDGLVNNLLGSTSAGVGSLIAEGNKEKILKTYWELTAIRFWIAGVFVFALYKLLPPFISLWLGSQYVLSHKVLLLVLISYFLSLVRGTNDQFILGHGLFYDVWAPLVEAIILVSVAVLGGKLWGFEGVLLGGIVSSIAIIYIWKPYMLFSKGFKLPLLKYWIPWIWHLFIMFCSFAFSLFVLSPISYLASIEKGWLEWIICAAIITFIHSLVAFTLFFIGTSGMRNVVHRFITKVRR